MREKTGVTAVQIRHGWGWLLLATIIISTIGDEISLITLMFRMAGEQTKPAVPMLLVAELLPGLLVTPFIGRMVDAQDAGRLLVATALAEAVIIAWMAWHPDLASTIAGAGVLSILFAAGGTASFALIPVLAARLGMALPRANAVLEFVRSAGMLAGPVVGGMLVAQGGTATALLIDAASFALFAAVVAGSGLRRPIEPRADDQTRTLLAAYWPVLRNRRIAVMIGALTLGVYAAAICDVTFVFLVTVTLAAGPAAFGMLTACWAGGMMAGAALAGATTMRHPAVAFAAAAVMGGVTLAIGVAGASPAGGILAVGIAFVVGGAANSVHNVAVRTMLQAEAPAGAQGKVAAIYGAGTSSAAILGYMTGGLFTPDRAISAYVLAGTLEIGVGLLGWSLFVLTGARAARPAR